MHVHTSNDRLGYTLQVRFAGGGNGYTLHVHGRLMMVLLLLYTLLENQM
jgi:hypothetical protein